MIPAEQYDDDFEVFDAVDFEEDDDDDEEEFALDEDDYEEFEEPEDSVEDWDDEAAGESLAERRRRRYRRFPVYRRRRYKRRGRRPRRYRGVSAIRRGIVRTPAGTARVQLPRSVPTRSSVDNRFKEVKREIARNAKAVAKVDRTLDKNTSIVDKKINAVSADLRRATKKMQDRLQQATLLPLLLQTPPQLATVKLPPDSEQMDPAGGPRIVKVDRTEYKSSSSNLLPLLLLSGGLGGGSGSSSNMLVLALALSGGLGGS